MKDIAFIGDKVHQLGQPDLASAAPGDVVVIVERSITLTAQQVQAALAAANNVAPGPAKVFAFTVVLQADGTGAMSYRALRFMKADSLVDAALAGQATQLAGKVIDV